MKRVIVIGVVVAIALALCWPLESVTVPAWRFRVVDRNGQPVVHAWVRQHWQNYSFESLGHEQDAETDDRGGVTFPERRARAGLWRRVCYPVWETLMLGVHASYGPSAHTLSQHDGYEGGLQWTGGGPLPDTLVLSHEMKPGGDA